MTSYWWKGEPDEQESRQAYVTSVVQEVQREGVWTFADLLDVFRNAGIDYDSGARSYNLHERNAA